MSRPVPSRLVVTSVAYLFIQVPSERFQVRFAHQGIDNPSLTPVDKRYLTGSRLEIVRFGTLL